VLPPVWSMGGARALNILPLARSSGFSQPGRCRVAETVLGPKRQACAELSLGEP